MENVYQDIFTTYLTYVRQFSFYGHNYTVQKVKLDAFYS